MGIRSFLLTALMAATHAVPAFPFGAGPSPRTTASDPGGRPACPPGWTDFQNPLLGLQAHVPTNYWVRLRGGVMLTVERQDRPLVLAFLLPFRPRPQADARTIAGHFSQFVAQTQPQWKAQIVGDPTRDQARSHYTSVVDGQAVEGRFTTLLAAGGSMAFVIGIQAAAGQLEAERATLGRIAEGFGFAAGGGRWTAYTSPAGGFTMSLPARWQVQSNDGQTSKDDIDWVATDPGQPLSRAFQWCPRYCSPQLLQDPLHALRGYQAGQFATPEQVIVTSLGQIAENPRLVKISVNTALTGLFRRLNQDIARLFASLGVGQTDITVYDCLAEARLEGRPVVVAMVAGLQSTAFTGGLFGPLTDLRVTLRGWCAAPERFLLDSPVLERVGASMQLSPAFVRRIVQNDARAAEVIRDTYAHMNRIDDQIRQSRWDTMEAIAEMNYDVLRDTGGYVNEATGRIEQFTPDQAVKNRNGELVSREEVERGIDPNQATVLRDAHANDYMRGVYGRVEFY